MSGFVALDSGKICLNEIDNCETYSVNAETQTALCDKCLTDFQNDLSKQFCHEKSDPNCSSYESLTNAIKCSSCNTDYIFEESFQKCILRINNCSEYTMNGTSGKSTF